MLYNKITNWLSHNVTNLDDNIFYIGKRQTPIRLTVNKNKILVKLGSGFASYTLESDKKELSDLSQFINNFLQQVSGE
jgi:hypothetical protein